MEMKGELLMEHQLGKCDFPIVEQEFPIAVFHRKNSSVWEFVDIPGHAAVLLIRGKRKYYLQSIETYACKSGNYEETMQKINAMANQYRKQQKDIHSKES